ncbi:MAG: hypothetical protein EZS28_021751 [Streblomastix strix]|uniref:Uncharacterized protein n=1 Tax=Streblomastix strix TaxID=222440 RepID=A0A5J4VJU7_9EUKA|nr:MAG: hypothetical protein EZS28_021751 [Streblomastix strix]
MVQYQTLNYAKTVSQNTLQAIEQLQPKFMNAFRQNLEIDPLDLDKTIAKPEEVSPNAITAAPALMVGFQDHETQQIDYCAEEPSEEQVIEAIQHISAATDLVTRWKPPKHNNLPAQRMLAFDQILADLEMKLLQKYRLPEGILKKIVRYDWIATQKFNLCTFISIIDTIYKGIMTRALMDSVKQGKLLKTQPSPVIRPGLNEHIQHLQTRYQRGWYASEKNWIKN